MFDSSADSENIITQPAREFDDIKSESLNVKQLLQSLNRGDRRNNDASKFIRYLKIAVCRSRILFRRQKHSFKLLYRGM